MNKIVWFVVVAEAVLIWFVIGSFTHRKAFRPLVTPEPHSIAQLRQALHIGAQKPCNLGSPRIQGNSTSLRPLSGNLLVTLPGQWKVAKRDTAELPFHTPEIVYANEREARVTIAHDPSSNGSSYEADPVTTKPLPARYCEQVMDSSGTIWTLYPPDTRLPGPAGHGRFTAFGEAVTAKGQRYKLRIGSWSEGERDSLAAIISAAVVSR